jgi:hypothetical protein
MDNTKIAWLAGIIDGEGTIGMYEAHSRSRWSARIWDTNYLTQVDISNDNVLIIEESLEVISEIVGRKVRLVYDRRDDRKFIHYRVTTTARNDIIKILTAITPYLIGKKAQAKLLLNMLKNHRYKSKYTKAELDVINILKRMKDDDKTLAEAEGNTVPMRDEESSQKCVETIQATLPFSYDGVKIESDLIGNDKINTVNHADL